LQNPKEEKKKTELARGYADQCKSLGRITKKTREIDWTLDA
jgi:hypothetical protein